MTKVPEYNLPVFAKPRRPKSLKPGVARPGSEELRLRERLVEIRVAMKRLEKEKREVVKSLGVVRRFRLSGEKTPHTYLYALKLEDGCYYVGMTHDVEKRYLKHCKGTGAAWTRMHKPIEILERREIEFTGQDDVAKLEDDMTLEYALKYGSSVVRGGGYCQTKPRWPDVVSENELAYV